MTLLRIALLIGLGLGMTASADESWETALGRMPLTAPATVLNRSNCVALMLHSFQSNATVKALIFMPGATDEIDFFRRAEARLTNAHPSLLDAVTALTNQTFVQVAFHPPLLILHTTEDPLDTIAIVKNRSTATKLRQRTVPVRVVVRDADWDEMHSTLDRYLSIGLRPRESSPDSWHFYRHNFAAAGLTEWEMLETLALAGKTSFTVNWLSAGFVPDRRQGAAPKLERFPR
jgi:hypothetical protein